MLSAKTRTTQCKNKMKLLSKNFALADINIESEIWLNLWKLRQCLSNASEIFFGEWLKWEIASSQWNTKAILFKPLYRLFPIIIPCKHLWGCHPFGLLILLCGPESPAWFISCFLHQISSQLLLAYTFDFVCRYSLPLETSCYQVTKSQWSGSLLVVTAVTLCSTNGVMVYR